MSRKLKNLVYEGFGAGLGLLAAFAVYMTIGLVFFIPGFLLVNAERGKEVKNTASQGIGIALMAIGVIVMGGAGLGFLLDSLSDMV